MKWSLLVTRFLLTCMVSIDTNESMDPTHKKISGKIRQAKEAVEAGKVLLIDQDVIAADLLELKVDISSQLPALLLEILGIISPIHYAGGYPPLRSYKGPILNCELFAFVADVKSTGCSVYLKFAVKNDFLWLASLHEDKPLGKEHKK